MPVEGSMEAKPPILLSSELEAMRLRVLARLQRENPAGLDEDAALTLGVEETRAARRERLARKAG